MTKSGWERTKDGGAILHMDRKWLVDNATVLGTCRCGKDAQTAVLEGERIVYRCWDCLDKEKKQ